MSPSTINQIILSIGIVKDKLIDGLCTVVKFINQRFTQMIYETDLQVCRLLQLQYLLFPYHFEYHLLQRINNICPVFFIMDGAQTARFAHLMLAVSRIRLCFFQVIKSDEEKASKNTCLSYGAE